MSKSKYVKGLAIAASLALAFTVTGCGPNAKNTGKDEGAKASNFPTKQVELVVPYAAGGGTDNVARALAEATKTYLGQGIGVTNKTGGGGAVGMTDVKTSKADGYKILMATVEMTTLPPLGLASFTSDDFVPVVQVNFDPAAITVKADAPWNTIEEFLDYAKKNPGKVRIGNSGTGAIWHLAAAEIERATGTKFNHVPFDGAAPAVTAVLGGNIEAVSVSPAEVQQQVKAGKLKTLAVLADKRSESLPDVPTFAEKGFKDIKIIGTWRGIVAPKGTPEDALKVLRTAFEKGGAEASFVDILKKAGLGYSLKNADGFAQTIKTSNDTFKELVPALGLKK